jgi:tetratricopeptide (TPR) repeat protein/tRNA A-37 threonylcarbamoyl transferase component Bud32
MECFGENTITDLVDAMLSPERRVVVEAHTATCESCRLVLSELVRRSTASFDATPRVDIPARRRPAPGMRVGRYELREQIGRGAMGAVYAGFDPELDRAIALKLLHAGDDTQRARIQHEARALARLRHPNVVSAYDLGELDGELVLAMELVDGASLREWMRGERPVADIVRVFAEAGRGLAAVHAAGLVHRDFKPDNVLVGGDGRVCIVDFGLAAGRDGSTELVGTPAYMAPEQFEVPGAAPASDQFSFCVALYEALYRVRPFAVNLVEEVARGPRWPTGKRPVPHRVVAVVARGLDLDPAKRFPSMDALVRALVPPPSGPKKRTVVAVGVAATVVASVGVFAVTRALSSEAPLCQDSSATFAKVWSSSRASAIRARFAATRAPYSADAWRSVEAGIAAFGERWMRAELDSCEASRVRGVESDQLHTLKSACLSRALVELDELAAVLADADAEMVQRAPLAVEQLSSLEECANVTTLLAPIAPPSAADAAAVAAIERQLARGEALMDAGALADAKSVALAAVERANATAHGPTKAAALALLGEIQSELGDHAAAETALREAYAEAERGHDDLLAARAAAKLVFVIGMQRHRHEPALDWGFHAKTTLERAGGNRRLEAHIADSLGSTHFDMGKYDLARADYEVAHTLYLAESGPSSLAVGKALANVGLAVMAQGNNEEGLALAQRAAAVIEAAVGPKHPDVGAARNILGSLLYNAGQFEAALATLDTALAILLPMHGELHPKVGQVYINRGFVLEALGRPKEAIASLDHAIRAIADTDPRLLATTLVARGASELSLGNTDAALATQEQALALRKKLFGTEHEDVAQSLEELGALHAQRGEHAKALALYQDALAIRLNVGSEDYFENAYSLAGIGRAEIELGRPADAVPRLRKAITLISGFGGDYTSLAEFRFQLARALWPATGSRDEARALAALAANGLAKQSDPVSVQALARVREWQQQHR